MNNRITAEIQGLLLSSAVILLVGCLMAVITFLTPLKESALGPLADLTLVLGVFAGACLTARQRGSRGLIRGGLLGLIVFGIIFFITLFADSSLISVSSICKELFFAVAAGCLGGVLGVGTRN